MNISDLFLEGRGRPALVEALEEFERRLESVEENARLVDEEISFAVFFGFRIPYNPVSDAMLACGDVGSTVLMMVLGYCKAEVLMQRLVTLANFAGQKSVRNRNLIKTPR